MISRIDDFFKVLAINVNALTASLSAVEWFFRIAAPAAALLYTCMKIEENLSERAARRDKVRDGLKFTTPLCLEWLDRKTLKRRGKPSNRPHAQLSYPCGLETIDGPLEVPAGFVTDFASIPRIFWSLLSPTDLRYSKPAVVHDYGYQFGGVYLRSGGDRIPKPMKRKEVDRLFLDLMATQGTGFKGSRIFSG